MRRLLPAVCSAVWPSLSSAKFSHVSRLLCGRVIPYKLADIGEGITEVEVLQLSVRPGDVIAEFDKICEVQSDKATVDITSRYSGTVGKVHVAQGETAKVGAPLIDIEVDEEEETDAAVAAAKPAPSSAGTAPAPAAEQPRPASSVAGGKVLASPATRYLGRELHVPLAAVRGTGRGGRVTKQDVLNFASSRAAGASSSAAGAPAPPAGTAGDAPSAGGVKVEDGDEVVPIAGVRRGMARSMMQAASIPRFSFSEEFELSRLMALRRALQPAAMRRSGDAIKLSFMPFLIKAASLALLAHPEVNAHCSPDCEFLIKKKNHNIGFAVDTAAGLVVPVVRQVQTQSIFELAGSIHALIQRSREGRLSLEDMSGGTFTLSNIGAIGATYASPINLPPQVAIGAVGRLQVLPRFDDAGEVIKANIAMFSFTADHRVIDGATMVRFANTFKNFVEHPEQMLLDAR